jgi:hypothetical protein
MPTIKKATIKAYDAATHTATVQVAGSLGVWLSAIRVATDIPAADVVVGRQCTVLFLDPANQDDAVVLSIQGALPSGGGVSDHGALTGLGDDDHPQYGALAQAETWAALQTFSAGVKLAAAQAIKDSGGADRITPAASSPHVTLAGDIRLGDRAAIATPVDADVWLLVRPGVSGQTGTRKLAELGTNGLSFTGNNNILYGLVGAPTASFASGSTGHNVQGLNYSPFVGGGGAGTVVSSLIGAMVQPGAIAYTGTITELIGFKAKAPLITSAATLVPLAVGLDAENYGNTKTTGAIGLRVQNQSGATSYNYNVEVLGATVTLLRVVPGDPANPGAGLGRSQLLLSFNENGTINLRRVEWKNPDGTGHMTATDKVLVAV